MLRRLLAPVVVGSAVAAFPPASLAQEPAGLATAMLAPSLTVWRFQQPVMQDSFPVRRAWQLALPVSTTLQFGRVTLDAGASYATGQVGLADGRNFDLSGLTDVRVRGVARVIGDRLLVTLGFNAPVGSTRLSGHAVDALGVLGAPALGFAIPNLGNGLGATGGLVYAARVGSWGLALGSSYEMRSRYTPIEAQIAGIRSPADLDPGNTVRFSLGIDRLVGQGRVSILLAGDLFGVSRLTLSSGGTATDSRYKLGPQLSATVVVEPGLRGFRSVVVVVTDRYRTRYTGFDGNRAPKSNGNVLEALVEAVTGGSRGPGLYVRADGRLDSGLDVDDTITTAAMSAAGLSLGISAPMGRATVVPFVRVQAGRLDTGPASTTALGYGAGITLTVRR